MNSSKFKNPLSSEDYKNSDNSRRSFLKKSAVGTAMIASSNVYSIGSKNLVGEAVQNGTTPWYQNVTRWGQVNITEKDPPLLDILWWRKHWKETQTEGVVINAGGIVAYYPTKIKFHHKAKYLNDRDLFGELSRAAHEDGIVVFARMDSNRAYEDLYQAHPDWFAVDAAGKPYKSGEHYITCVNGPYYKEHIPAILKEISEMYHPDGFTDNSWSGLGRESICHCTNCKKSFRDKTGNDIPLNKNWDDAVYKKWIRWNYDRRLEIWDFNNRTTKAAGGNLCIWSGMNSGSISSQCRDFRDYKEICKKADIIMLDDQSRGEADGFQHNTDIGNRVHGMLGWDKLIPESMAMYQHGRPTFRVGSKSVAEARMWMIEGIAGGIQPWWHHVAAYHDDRRMYHTAEPIYKWHKANKEYLINRIPVATIGVVWSQENFDYYGRDNTSELVELPMRGINQALLRARIPYLPIHADHIERDGSKLSLLILPNLAAMSDNQISMVKKFVDKGGNLIATGETSLYNEWGEKRSDFGLADLFGAHIPENNAHKPEIPTEKLGGNCYHTYLRLTPELRAQVDGPINGSEPKIIGKRHEVLKGFEETDILPFGGLLQSLDIAPGTESLLTYIPQFPVYPPEIAWMREPKTEIPGLLINSGSNGSRILFIPADIDRQYGRNNLPDHGNLLRNLIHWAAKDTIPFRVVGKGVFDCHLYRQKDRMVFHLVNLTNASTPGSLDEYVPMGPLEVHVKLPVGISARNIRLLVKNQTINATIANGWAKLEINSVLDHEVLVIS